MIAKCLDYIIRDVRASIVVENEWPSHDQLRSVLVHFPAKFLHGSTIIHSIDTSSTWDSICNDESIWSQAKIIICLTIGWALWTVISTPAQNSLVHVSSIATIRTRMFDLQCRIFLSASLQCSVVSVQQSSNEEPIVQKYLSSVNR